MTKVLCDIDNCIYNEQGVCGLDELFVGRLRCSGHAICLEEVTK